MDTGCVLNGRKVAMAGRSEGRLTPHWAVWKNRSLSTHHRSPPPAVESMRTSRPSHRGRQALIFVNRRGLAGFFRSAPVDFIGLAAAGLLGGLDFFDDERIHHGGIFAKEAGLESRAIHIKHH